MVTHWGASRGSKQALDMSLRPIKSAARRGCGRGRVDGVSGCGLKSSGEEGQGSRTFRFGPTRVGQSEAKQVRERGRASAQRWDQQTPSSCTKNP